MKYNAYIDQLYEFHNAFNHPINVPDPNLSLLTLRADLIQEEAKEVNEAFDNVICGQYELPFDGTDKTVNKAALLKELCDLLYVVFGAAVALGLPIQEAFNRVHASNMSKLGDDGKPIYREDGKVLKGPNYKAPDLSDLV
jgi:predicted HAD superfamily Cof-like phosphohydrolase